MIVDKKTFDMTWGVKDSAKWENRGLGVPTTAKDCLGLGYYVAVGPMSPPETEVASNMFCQINYTGPPGSCSDLLYKFTFQIPKWGYGIAKVDEWIEVSPTNREYYDRTLAMKDQLSNQIKQGLAHAATAVSDFELVNHDVRKYKEIMGYFNDKNEHSLRAMFIDQIDVHNGGMAMVQMVQRWSTLIMDFQQLTDDDISVDGIAKRLKIPKAEAVILKTKNLLYKEWKKLFKTATVSRYERLLALVHAREKSIDEYKEWLKPYVVRFKRLRAGHSDKDARHDMLKSFVDITGQTTFTNYIRFWTWKFFKPVETRKAAIEKTTKWWVEPYDRFTRENFVIHPTKGLAAIYPWLLDPWKPGVKGKEFTADKLVEKLKKRIEAGLEAPAMRSYYMYYSFNDLIVKRVGIRTPTGEQEDITFNMKGYLYSQNIMLVKRLEMKCREIELNRYIDTILGLKINNKSSADIAKKEFPNVYDVKEEEKKTGIHKIIDDIRNKKTSVNTWFGDKNHALKKPNVPGKFMFFKPGPYEFDFGERINKGYLVPLGGYYHVTWEGFLKKHMNIH
jgi:hypothetical protein